MSSELAALDDPLELARFTRFDDAAGGGRVAESSLRLSGMHCAACAGLIESALRRQPGVVDVQVNAASERAQVRWQPGRTRASALVEAVRAAGYDAVPDTAAGERALRRSEGRRMLWRLVVAWFCAMQVMMLATPSYVAGPGELAPDLRRLLNVASWMLSLPVLCFSAQPFLAGAWRALRARRIGMDVPVAIGIVAAFVASSGAAFDPAGPFGAEVYFDSLTMFVSFLLLGRWLETRARHRATDRLEDSLARLPATAERLRADGSAETVSVQRLQVGDVVRVPQGEAFPADGLLLQGRTEADESLASGESRPVAKQAGDTLVGGSVNVGAPALMRLERVGADTRYEAIAALVRGALAQRPASARLADRWAGPFLWAVLALALGAGLVWQQIDPSRAVWVAVSVLIVTCPCALSLAAPAAMLSAAGALARRGVLLRRIDALETLAGVRRIFLDKTGTLTDPQPRFAGAELVAAGTGGCDDTAAATWDRSSAGRDALLHAAAALAGWSRHPLSRALGDAGVAAPAAAAPAWTDVREQPGAGLEGRDAAGRRWRLGSAAWVGVASGARAAAPGKLGDAAGTTDASGASDAGAALESWFACIDHADGPLLRLRFDERLRDGAIDAVRALQAEGVQLTLLSGDDPARVARVARQLGIAQAHGAATPEDKLAAVRAAQARGETVAMLGDGVNDAPVLAQADVSFAMGHGALLARVHADAVMLSDRPADLAGALRLARRSVRIVRQNLAWAALYNAACVPLALAGLLPPWAAGLGMALSSLGVVANAMRLAR